MPVITPSQFASTGSPGRILADDGTDVHIDVIESESRRKSRSVSSTQRETGAPLTSHVLRELEEVQWTILISDDCPVAGAAASRWENDHARRTRDRLWAVARSTIEMRLFNGLEFLRTPAGISVWVLREVTSEETASEPGTYRATLTFTESPTASTVFTEAQTDVDPELADALGSPVERGRQSTTQANDGGAIAAGAWPP